MLLSLLELYTLSLSPTNSAPYSIYMMHFTSSLMEKFVISNKNNVAKQKQKTKTQIQCGGTR